MMENSTRFIVYKRARSEWRWEFRGEYDGVIAKSPDGYATKQSCLNGLVAVKRLAPQAEVVEVVV